VVTNAPSSEKVITRLPTGSHEILVNCLPGLFGQFKAHRSAGLPLTHSRPRDGVPIRGYVIYSDRDNVAATQLAIDRQIE
jgi:hypothetical protein